MWQPDRSDAGQTATVDARSPLYVQRKLLNASDLADWARENGFTSIQEKDFHVTLAFSRTPVDWGRFSPYTDCVIVPRVNIKQVEPLGNEGAVVLHFWSPRIISDHNRFIQGGASWDFDSYKPHVTISYGGMPENIKPYDDILIFGPEEFRELDLT